MKVPKWLAERLALTSYLTLLLSVGLTNFLAMLFYWRPLSQAFLALEAILIFLPLEYGSDWAKSFNRYAMGVHRNWHKFSVVYDGGKSKFQEEKNYVIGHEPHSVLPYAYPMLFGDQEERRVPGLGPIKILCTSVVFWVPVIRHLLHCLGGVPASRKNAHELLEKGISIFVVPGGVAECAYMESGKDIVFLKNRYGFVKLALQHGADLVPSFAFGQNNLRFWRIGPQFLSPELYRNLVRKLLFVPMVFVPFPLRTRMTLVFGEPIPVPKTKEPSQELVQTYLNKFIEEMKSIYDRHKVEAGFPNSKLIIL